MGKVEPWKSKDLGEFPEPLVISEPDYLRRVIVFKSREGLEKRKGQVLSVNNYSPDKKGIFTYIIIYTRLTQSETGAFKVFVRLGDIRVDCNFLNNKWIQDKGFILLIKYNQEFITFYNNKFKVY